MRNQRSPPTRSLASIDDPGRVYDRQLPGLCEPCHKSAKRQIEIRGYRCDIGLDGYPTDPNHPFNRAR
jgi:hypothetical protein